MASQTLRFRSNGGGTGGPVAGTAEFSFDFLDDVSALPLERFEELAIAARIVRLGPFIEYACHRPDRLAVRTKAQRRSPVARCFGEIIERPTIADCDPRFSLETKDSVEFCRTPQLVSETDDSRWVAFCKRVMDAAEKSGLSRSFGQGLAGTLEEMTSNVLEHSEYSMSGFVGYRWIPGEFEYVVVDSGIGVLESLRKHPDYSWLIDAGDALEVAVADGESRHGRAAHRGTGFHNLLHNIASRNSYIRFRSGDHGYIIDGRANPILKKTFPASTFEGFLISILCIAPK